MIWTRSKPTQTKQMKTEIKLTSSELTECLLVLGFSPESLLASKETRNLARKAINKHCGTKWANGRLIAPNGCDYALWTLYTANKGQSFDVKISQ
jgi:hypothetical protein